jgi:ComF family protein
VGAHAPPLQGAIHALKYDGVKEVAEPLGRLLAERWQAAPGARVAGIIPVPLHPARQEERGFNQSALLARALAEVLALPVREELLSRSRATVPQVGLPRAERLKNVAGAFRATPEAAGQPWLLVDDVCTSGATLDASASALRAQGARAIWAITVARPAATVASSQ